jgi:hypothetical protein
VRASHAAASPEEDPLSPRTLQTARRGEARLPAAIAVLVGIGLYAGLPSELMAGPRYLVPALELLLLLPLIAINPRRFTKQTRLSRLLSLGLVLVIALANLISLGFLVAALVASEIDNGKALLLASLQIWLTNIIVFGLAFWELDRGGPVARTQRLRKDLPPADFRFSQDENHDAVVEVATTASKNSDWVPTLTDYLYVSVTNSTAFSPTDTMPLTSRAKVLMSIESVAALLTSVLVIARGISLIE